MEGGTYPLCPSHHLHLFVFAGQSHQPRGTDLLWPDEPFLWAFGAPLSHSPLYNLVIHAVAYVVGILRLSFHR